MAGARCAAGRRLRSRHLAARGTAPSTQPLPCPPERRPGVTPRPQHDSHREPGGAAGPAHQGLLSPAPAPVAPAFPGFSTRGPAGTWLPGAGRRFPGQSVSCAFLLPTQTRGAHLPVLCGLRTPGPGRDATGGSRGHESPRKLLPPGCPCISTPSAPTPFRPVPHFRPIPPLPPHPPFHLVPPLPPLPTLPLRPCLRNVNIPLGVGERGRTRLCTWPVPRRLLGDPSLPSRPPLAWKCQLRASQGAGRSRCTARPALSPQRRMCPALSPTFPRGWQPSEQHQDP